jgi:predicted NACHT family NTPase
MLYEVYRDLSVERKLELLSYVAVKKFEQEQYVLFEQEELEGYIGEFLGISLRESRGVLQAITSQHGLLIERAQNVWSFSHLTFQEYLVAMYYHTKTEWQGLVNHVSLRYWQEVFLLTVDMIPSADNLLLLMKTWIDRLLAEEQVLQQLLIWIHIKALKIDSYKSTVNVRAFYLSLVMVLL